MSLEHKINKYENKLGDLRDKIKNIFVKKGKSVPTEEEKKVQVYQNKLAYYRRMSNMRGGAEGEPGETVIIESTNPPVGENVEGQPGETVIINPATEEETTVITDDKGNVIRTDVGEPVNVPSGISVVDWTLDQQNNFLALLEKYGDDLVKLIDNIKDLTKPQQQVITGIADKIRNLGKQLEYKDDIIDKYIEIFSKTQKNLSDWKIEINNQPVDTADADAEIIGLGNLANKNLQYYEIMMHIHDYLIQLKTKAGMKQDNEFQRIMTEIDTIMKYAPVGLGSTLKEFASTDFTLSDPGNEAIRAKIFERIRSA